MEPYSGTGQGTDEQFFLILKRRERKDERSLTEKATGLLTQCNGVTIASADSDVFPHPVPMSNICSKGCNEVLLATAARSVIVADFKLDSMAGLSYSNYGDSVGLRVFIETITDDTIHKGMWQSWLINHLHGGPADPDSVLLHFAGKETTFWINGEFAHEKTE